MKQLPGHVKHFFADDASLHRAAEEANRKTGFVPDPALLNLTTEQVTEQSNGLYRRMVDSGIRPADNFFTCLLYEMRDGEDEDAQSGLPSFRR